jgi:LCP family protein required for cell wall assembly
MKRPSKASSPKRSSTNRWTKILWIALLGPLILASCAPLAGKAANALTSPQISFATSDPNATATATPFQPVGPLSALIGTPVAPSPTPRPTTTPTTEPGNVTAEQILSKYSSYQLPQPVPDGLIKILLLGSDQRSGPDFRTDVIMLVVIDPSSKTVSLVSFPRDTYVYLPSLKQMNRINTAMEFGGFPLTQSTFLYNFGFQPDHYVLTTFSGFTNIVDSLGGVDVTVTHTLSDECSLPFKDGSGWCTVNPGVMHMDGQTALWYARSRYTTSDFDRTQRAQEVIMAIFHKVISLNGLTRLPELYQAYQQAVQTDLGLTDVISLIPTMQAVSSNPGSIRRFAIGPQQLITYHAPDTGAYLLVPKQQDIGAVLMQAFSP